MRHQASGQSDRKRSISSLMPDPRSLMPSLPYPMPIYVYEYLDDTGVGTGESFEIVQSMSEDALTAHEGRPVHRVPQAPNIAGKWTDMKAKGQLSNDNLDRLGFTKYERTADGQMTRVAGKEGPETINH